MTQKNENEPAPSALTIRPATPADLPAILDIYNHAVLHSTATADHDPQSLEARQEWYEFRARKNLPVLVAVDGAARVVGWGALNPYHTRKGYRLTADTSV